MTDLHQAAREYLPIRRALGFKLSGYDRLLEDFVGYLCRCDAPTITAKAALSWATGPEGVTPHYWASRLGVVRGFARHLQGFDPAVEVPPANLVISGPCRRSAYQFSPQDLERLVGEAGRLTPALRGATYEAFFGLLICSGARVGEAIKLDRADVDIARGVVDINDAKSRKHRRFPLHHTAVDALGRYSRLRDKACPRPKAPSFFVSTRGTRLLYVVVNQVFRELVGKVGLEDQPGAGHPRIHDLRHHFIMASLADFHRQGADPQGKLPLLSAYVGHSDPAYTYHYFHAGAELLALAAQRLEQFERGRR